MFSLYGRELIITPWFSFDLPKILHVSTLHNNKEIWPPYKCFIGKLKWRPLSGHPLYLLFVHPFSIQTLVCPSHEYYNGMQSGPSCKGKGNTKSGIRNNTRHDTNKLLDLMRKHARNLKSIPFTVLFFVHFLFLCPSNFSIRVCVSRRNRYLWCTNNRPLGKHKKEKKQTHAVQQ